MRARNNIAWIFNEGHRVERNVQEAIRHYEICAKAGYAIGQYSLARMYEFGEGGEIDKVKAVEWYKKAADQGNYMPYNLTTEEILKP